MFISVAKLLDLYWYAFSLLPQRKTQEIHEVGVCGAS